MKNRHIFRRTLCAFLALCMTAALIGTPAFAEQTKWTQVETASTSTEFASLMGGEFYEASTPSGEKNALYVKGKTRSGVKMLRIALYSLAQKQNYINVFVRPASDGSFAVKINTAAQSQEVTATTGKVFTAADEMWDSQPGHKPVETMPKGFYLLRLAVAKTDADADLSKWGQGTLGGGHGFVWNTAMLYVSGSGNDPRLIEFSDIVNSAKKTQSTGSVYNSLYTDVYLKDMSYVLKDADFNNKPMTAQRVSYMKTVAGKITSGAATDAEKLAKIYEYVTTNFYYDRYAYNLYQTAGVNIQCVNPYDNLYNQRNHIASTNSTGDGKVATVCDGYAALIVSLCRSLGIPSRSVYGCTNNTSDGLTSQVNAAKKNHWWAEVYIDGRWVTVDAERGALNFWNRNELSLSGLDSRYRDEKYKSAQYWDRQGMTVSGLDMSYAARAVNFMLTGVQDNTEGKPYVESISAVADSVSGKPKLTWTAMSGAEKYYIYRGTSERSLSYYASSKTNSYIDTAATVGTTYYYRVTPVMGTEGAMSNMVFVKCAAAQSTSAKPTAPVLNITTSAGKPQIYWSPVSGAARYSIYRSTDGKAFKYYDSTRSTSYTNTGAVIGTTYYYKILAVSSSDKYSNFSNVKGIRCTPAAPRLNVYRSNGKPQLKWNAVTGATKYWVYRSTDGKNFSVYTTVTGTSYTNSGAASGTKYYYKVKAVKVVNGVNVASAFSSTKNIITTLVKPTVKITTSNGKPRLTWSAVKGADKYYVYRSTDGKNFSYYDTTKSTSYTNTGAKKNTKYYYKVRAVCASNSNANSAQSTAVGVKATK